MQMTRHESRELAFILLFEKSFQDAPVKEILLSAGEARDVEENAFALSLAEGTEQHWEEIDRDFVLILHFVYRQAHDGQRHTGYAVFTPFVGTG